MSAPVRWGLALLVVASCATAIFWEPSPSADSERAAGTQPGTLEARPPATTGRPVDEDSEAAAGAADPNVRTPVRRLGAVLQRRVQLRAAPGGKALLTLARKTKFGSRTDLAVVARQGEWLGVLHSSIAHGKAGWIPADAVRLEQRPWEIVVRRSKLRATVLHDGKVVSQFKIGVGRKGNETPLGRYAITDLLAPSGGGPYGCCIMAITARQPDLPQGWAGGDRIAFHGGPSWRVGIRTTSGCMTVRDGVLKRLMKRTVPGTRVTVRA